MDLTEDLITIKIVALEIRGCFLYLVWYDARLVMMSVPILRFIFSVCVNVTRHPKVETSDNACLLSTYNVHVPDTRIWEVSSVHWALSSRLTIVDEIGANFDNLRSQVESVFCGLQSRADLRSQFESAFCKL